MSQFIICCPAGLAGAPAPNQSYAITTAGRMTPRLWRGSMNLL